MAKYTGDSSLIQGAGVAYKDWGNVPGMYSGLDKVGEKGSEVVDTAVAEFEAEEKKREAEAEKLKKEQEALDKNWAAIAAEVYANAGGFLKADGAEYKMTIEDVKALKADWLKAQETNDPVLLASVSTRFNNIKTDVNKHKELREAVADDLDGLSTGVKGKDKEWLTKWLEEEYTIIKNEKGEKVYTIGGVGRTLEQIKEIAHLKNLKPFNAQVKTKNEYSKLKKLPPIEDIHGHVRRTVVPDTFGGLVDFLNAPEFGSGQTFTEVHLQAGNRKSLEDQIKNTIFDGDENGVISNTEYENFLNAIVDPNNSFWKDNGGKEAWEKNARKIAVEQMTNDIVNHHKEVNKKEKSEDVSKFGLDLDARMYTLGKDQNYARIFGRDIENNIETFKLVQSKGSGPFKGWDGSNWFLRDGKWFGYNSETGKFDKPANANTIFAQLRWSNNEKIMRYLEDKPVEKEEEETKTPPNPEMLKELKKLEVRKNRSQWYIDGVTYKDYDKAVEAIKAKYQKK
tara:strand:+ start:272 stop:1801 length:1530 start_codon:yes stop_codon:yes gene_type:complete